MHIFDICEEKFEIEDFIKNLSKFNISGIYCWFNKLNGKIYIGSAKSLKIRFKSYIREFKKYKRRVENIRLFRSIKKYGLNNFLFIIIKSNITLDSLIMQEQKYLDEFTPYKREIGFNFSPTAGNCLNCKHTESTKKKQSQRRQNNHHWKTKIKKEDIPIIFDLLASGKNKNEIAKMFDVQTQTILAIQKRKSWWYVPIDEEVANKAKENIELKFLDNETIFKVGEMLNNKIHPKKISKILNVPQYDIMNINKGYTHKEVKEHFAPNQHRIFILIRHLSKKEKKEILDLLDKGKLTGTEIAKIYGVSDDYPYNLRGIFRRKNKIKTPKDSKYKGIYKTNIKGLWSAYIYNSKTKKQIFIATGRNQDELFKIRERKGKELGLL